MYFLELIFVSFSQFFYTAANRFSSALFFRSYLIKILVYINYYHPQGLKKLQCENTMENSYTGFKKF